MSADDLAAIRRAVESLRKRLDALERTVNEAKAHCDDPADRRRDEILRDAVKIIERMGQIGKWFLDRPTWVVVVMIAVIYYSQAGWEGIGRAFAEFVRRLQ